MKLKLSFPLGWLSAGSALVLAANLHAAPLFTLQPVSQTTYVGGSVTFTTAIDAASPMTLQWWGNATAIPGETSLSLTLFAVTTNQAGSYFLVASNASGSATSHVAVLTVLPGTTTSYVWRDSPNPTAPYDSWLTAAHEIQDAIETTQPGGQVLVTNGTYVGGFWVYKRITVRSINGPQLTVVNGTGGYLCAALASGAILSGFTLTNGAGGVHGESLGAVVVSNCVIAGNSTVYGGGAIGCRLYNCTLTGNSAWQGGGAFECYLYNCSLTGNLAEVGGGAIGGKLYNCTLSGNSARTSGGGVSGCALYNCITYFNTAPVGANYDATSILDFCCTMPLAPGAGPNISLNPELTDASHVSATSPCRGAGYAAFAAGTDIDGTPWSNPPSIGCDESQPGPVTGPLAVSLTAAYTNAAPGFPVSLTALINGHASLSVWDLGGGTAVSNRPSVSHTWAAPGDYSVTLSAFNDSHPAGVSAKLTIHVGAQPVFLVDVASSNPQRPYATWATAATNIQDAVDAAAFVGAGALVLVSNGVYATGGRPAAGSATTNRVVVDKPLTIRSVNGPEVTIIHGLKLPAPYPYQGQGQGPGAIRCVFLADGAVLDGFTLTNGATGNDPWSPDDASGGGVYCASTRATVTNCILTGNAAIIGGGAYAGTLFNCRVIGNLAHRGGGGAADATLYDCTLTTNLAHFGLREGGGAMNCTLYGCLLTLNAGTNGAGAYQSTLYNCTLSANSGMNAAWGCTLYNSALIGNRIEGAGGCTLYNCTLIGNLGGVYSSTLYNCIVYYNTAGNHNYGGSTFNYCSTTPMPANGVGNITNAPLFVSLANGNLRLQPSSPCINAGVNSYATTSTDLDGNPRIVGDTVDIGAYEFRSPASTISYAWLQQFGLPTDGSADTTDLDSDRHNNWQEWKAGTIPTNNLSVLRMLNPVTNASGLSVSWQSVADRTYYLERATDLGSLPPFLLLRSNLTGQAGTTSFTDSNAVGPGPFFYRVGVQE